MRRDLPNFILVNLNLFQNSKYLAIAFSINFKAAKYTSCFSALYMLRNVLLVKLAKLYTVNLYVFLSALYMLQYVPIVFILVIVYFFQKKKWVKIPKLCHNTPLSIFLLGKGRESLHLKTLHNKKKTKYKCTFCPAPSTKKIQIQTKHGRRVSKLPKLCIFSPANFAPFQ